MKFSELASSVKAILRIPVECSPRIVWLFMRNFGLRNLVNIRRFEKRQQTGAPFFPAFVMISVTESCNLTCSGCWVSPGGKQALSVEQLNGIIEASKQKGSYFFGILGGEPLLYKGLFTIFATHSDCYFQLFTNGTLITNEIALKLKKVGNVTPLISIEGLEVESDIRRGKEHVFERTLEGVRACHRAKLIVGAAASICKSNYEALVNRNFLELVAKEGVHYFWYYIYRPVGPNPNVSNALDQTQIINLRQFLVDQRMSAPLQLVDAYWDDKGKALCPGATGMSHHIAPSGAVEFCPPLQMAKEFINADASNLTEVFEHSDFLATLRKQVSERSRGCILLEDPEWLVQFLETHQAIDSTTRQTVLAEFKRMRVQDGHNILGNEIPEKNPLYKWLKKHYFFGFGAYG